MPPKRRAGAVAASKKASNKNGMSDDIKEKHSAEQDDDIDEVFEPSNVSPRRPKRAAKVTPVYSELDDEPQKKLAKMTKAKGKRGKIESEKQENENNDDEERDVEEIKKKPGKKGKEAEKKLKAKESEDNNDDLEDDLEEIKSKPEKAKRGEKKTTKSKEAPDHDDENDEDVEETEKKSEKKAKTGKKEKAVKKEKKVESKQVKSGRAGKKNQEPAETEENGHNEDAGKEKSGPLNTTSTKWDKINFKCSKKNAKGAAPNLRISCWNVGGLKSWIKKDCLTFLEQEKPDIFCLQETKCSEEKLPDEIKELTGYKQYWCSSDKEGYAGVGLLTKVEPKSVTYGINASEQDVDGRCITAEYDDYYVVCVYVPNAGRKLVTLPKRLDWNEAFKTFIKELDEKKPVIICGDMNVSHNEIDLARPKNNTKNAGFTQEERDGMTDFLGDGYVDTFRDLYPDKADMYTFWTYMANARAKNVGWRLDYFVVSERIKDNVCDNVIRKEVYGSDHCPITLFINL